MNRNPIDALLQFLPVILLIFWALNQVLGRNTEQPKNKPAPGRPPKNDQMGPFAGRKPPARPTEIVPPRPPRPSIKPGEEIVILSSEDRLQNRPQKAPPQDRPNRRSRSASSAQPQKKPVHKQAPVAGFTGFDQVAQMRARFTDDGNSSLLDSSFEAESPSAQPSVSSQRIDDFRQVLRDPQRVRDALILGELLKPPVALRNRPGPRR